MPTRLPPDARWPSTVSPRRALSQRGREWAVCGCVHVHVWARGCACVRMHVGAWVCVVSVRARVGVWVRVCVRVCARLHVRVGRGVWEGARVCMWVCVSVHVGVSAFQATG